VLQLLVSDANVILVFGLCKPQSIFLEKRYNKTKFVDFCLTSGAYVMTGTHLVRYWFDTGGGIVPLPVRELFQTNSASNPKAIQISQQ